MMQIWNPVGSLVPCVLNDAELESTVGRFPSRSLNGGASPHLCGALHHLSVGLPLCGALPHLAHSTVGLFSLYCGALLTLLWGSSHSTVGLPHLSVGLHLTVGLFPISLTRLWGSSHSTVGLFSLHCGAFPPLRGASSHCGALPHLAHSTGH